MKVIKSGYLKDNHLKKCYHCDCEFEYSGEDIKDDEVKEDKYTVLTKDGWIPDDSLDMSDVATNLRDVIPGLEKYKYLYTFNGYFYKPRHVICPECGNRIPVSQSMAFSSWGSSAVYASTFDFVEKGGIEDMHGFVFELEKYKNEGRLKSLQSFKTPFVNYGLYVNSGNRGLVSSNMYIGNLYIYELKHEQVKEILEQVK